MQKVTATAKKRSSSVSFRALLKRGTARAKTGDFDPLKDEELVEIASQMMDSLNKEMDETQEAFQVDRDNIQAQIDEVDMRMDQLRRETYEFKRDVIVGGEDPRTGRTSAEKVMRFLEEGLREHDTLTEKLELRTMMMKGAVRKMEQQLHHKAEMGDLLNVIDFEQLKIENQQHLEKIEAKNNELLQLKLTTGKTVQVMNSMKDKLNALSGQVETLKLEIADRDTQLGKIDDFISKAAEEAHDMERMYREQLAEKEDPEAPQVLDYIKSKTKAAELKQTASDWRRKVELATADLEKRQRTLRKREAKEARLASSGTASLKTVQLTH